MRIDDDWCAEAKAALPAGNYLVASLNRRYSYAELKEFDLIASCTTGLDHLEAREIPVISLQGETEFLAEEIWATAEHTWGLILALMRRIPAAAHAASWGRWQRDAFQGTELRGKTIGIIGYGRVGRQVATFADAFGMRVSPFDKGPGYDLGRTLSLADIATVHLPLTDETEGFFGWETFDRMQPGAYFVNTSRGGIVNEAALLAALRSGIIAGAALDVAQGEPDNLNPALLEYAQTHDNLILTPHLGGCTFESRRKTQVFITAKIKAFVEGKHAEDSSYVTHKTL